MQTGKRYRQTLHIHLPICFGNLYGIGRRKPEIADAYGKPPLLLLILEDCRLMKHSLSKKHEGSIASPVTYSLILSKKSLNF